MKSADGISWTESLQCGIIFSHGTALCYGGGAVNGTLIALGLGGSISNFAMSTDGGDSWTQPNSPVGNTTFMGDVDYAACAYSPRLNRFVATGAANGENAFAYSNDRGKNWHGIGKGPEVVLTNGGRGLIWVDPLFVSVGESADRNQSIATSPDGITWTAASSDAFEDFGQSLVYIPGNQTFLGCGNGAGGEKLQISTDPAAKNWTAVTDPFASTRARRVALAEYLNRVYVIDSGVDIFYTENAGQSWTEASISPGAGTSGFGLAARSFWPIDDYVSLPEVILGTARVVDVFNWNASNVFMNDLVLPPQAKLIIRQGPYSQNISGALRIQSSSLIIEQNGVFSAGQMVVSGPATVLKVLISSQSGTLVIPLFAVVSGEIDGEFTQILPEFSGDGCAPVFGAISLSAALGFYSLNVSLTGCDTTALPANTTATTVETTTTSSGVSSSTSVATTTPLPPVFTCPSTTNCSCVLSTCTITDTYSVGAATFTVPSGVFVRFEESWLCAPQSKVIIGIPSTASAEDGPILKVVGTAQLAGTLTLQLDSSLTRALRAVPASVAVVEAGAVTGMFESVVVTSTDPCESVMATPVSSSSTLSVTLTSTDTCASGGLPVGAIVGISVGVVLVGVVIALFVVLWWRRQRKRRESLFASSRAASTMTDYAVNDNGGRNSVSQTRNAVLNDGL